MIATSAEEFQPKYSPDGKEIAYIENRNILKVYNIASKNSRTILPKDHNHSYSGGDWDFLWGPDNKWLITDDQRGYFFQSNTALIKADGTGEIIYPINSRFGEGDAKVSPTHDNLKCPFFCGFEKISIKIIKLHRTCAEEKSKSK